MTAKKKGFDFMFEERKNNIITNTVRDALLMQKMNGAQESFDKNLNTVQKAILDASVAPATRSWMETIGLNLSNVNSVIHKDTNVCNLRQAFNDLMTSKMLLEKLQAELENVQEKTDAVFQQRFAHVTLPSDAYINKTKQEIAQEELDIVDDTDLLWQMIDFCCMNISLLLEGISMDYIKYLRGGATV